MKKLISYCLLLILGLQMFVSCGDPSVSNANGEDTTDMTDTAVYETTDTTEPPTPTTPIKVACVGDSLTYGNGHVTKAYPIVLQSLLGDNYEVMNFGAGGRTATEGLSDSVRVDRSYNMTQMYRDSIAMKADIVIICLGTNDLYECNLTSETGKQNYIKAMKNLISDYRKAGAKTVYICYPPYALNAPYNQVGNLVVPLVDRVAAECNVEVIDFYTTTLQNPNLIDSDRLHLTVNGYKTMAELVYQKLTGKFIS